MITEPSHSPIVNGLITARAARAAGHDEAAEHIITRLRAEHGAAAVRAVAIALAADPAPVGGASHA